jgi:hypothetical protein
MNNTNMKGQETKQSTTENAKLKLRKENIRVLVVRTGVKAGIARQTLQHSAMPTCQ